MKSTVVHNFYNPKTVILIILLMGSLVHVVSGPVMLLHGALVGFFGTYKDSLQVFGVPLLFMEASVAGMV